MNVFTIKHEQSLEVSPQGQTRETRHVHVAIHYDALITGWLARFASDRQGRSALPVLLALGLHARPLHGEDLAQLIELKLVAEADAGRLYARVTDVGLADELGLHRTTVNGAVAWLHRQQLVSVLDLPEDYRDSHGRFCGRHAYILRADGALSTVSVEATRNQSEPSTVSVEPTRTMSVEPTHRVGSVSTKKKEKEEKQEQKGTAAVVFSSFARIAGHPAVYQPTDKDRRLLDQLLAEGYTCDQIIAGIQSAIDLHRQRQPDGQVQRFAFCVPVIRESGQPARAYRRVSNPITSEAVPAVTGGDLPDSAVSPTVPGPGRSRGPGEETRPETVPAVTGESGKAQQAILAAVAQWYADEIGELTPMTRDTFRQLVAHYPNLAHWRDAFEASVGIPTPLGRWRYIQTVVANADRNPPDRQEETSAPKPSTDNALPPTLPDEMQADLERLGWAGPYDEVATIHQTNPELVEAWLEYWLEKKKPGFNAAGAFLKSLRTGQRPVRPQLRSPYDYGDGSRFTVEDDEEDEPAEEAGNRQQRLPNGMKLSACWQAALGELELQMTRETFNTWLKPTRVVSYENETLTIGVENGYIQDWLTHRLRVTVERTVTSIVGQPTGVQFVLWNPA